MHSVAPLYSSSLSSPSLAELLEESLGRVDAFIFGEIAQAFPLIHDVSHHLIGSGGKRLRPLLTMAAARLCGHGGEAMIPLAACVEFLHTATLLHDDVVDNSSLRRGLATANILWDNKSSILVGDYLFSKSFEIMVAHGDLEILKILSHATTRMAEGEVMQMTRGHQLDLSFDDYMNIIYGKTACLFEASMAVGARLAQSPHQDALALYGRSLGFAFQMIDDVLDYRGDASLGKACGDDFREGKLTLPFLRAYAMDADKVFWERVNDPVQQKASDFAEASSRMKALGVFDAIEKEAAGHISKAVQALDIFSDSLLKTALTDTAHQTIGRIN